MNKTLKMYAIGMVLVFVFTALVYFGADRASVALHNTVAEREARISALEDKLGQCVEMEPAIKDCAGALQEAEFWKELAESCVDRKVQVPKK